MNKIKKTTKDIIFEYLYKRNGKWINGGRIEHLAERLGKKSSALSRRCREMYNDGLIQRDLVKNKKTGVSSVWYRVS